MNHTLIKFLIKIVIINFTFSNNFEDWLSQNKDIINKNEIIKLSMTIDDFQVNDLSTDIADNQCYLILDLSKNIYEIKYLDNIIYYDKKMILQYNESNNQIFKYLPDKTIIHYLDKIILRTFFEFSNYKNSEAQKGYRYIYSNNLMNLKSKIYMNYSNNLVDILFIDDFYKISFKNIMVRTLDIDSVNNQLLVNKYKNIKDVEIFDFIN